MRRFVVETVVDAAVVAAIIIILSLFQVWLWNTPDLLRAYAGDSVLREKGAVDEPVRLRVATNDRGRKRCRNLHSDWTPHKRRA